jgi:hypothetical protein
MSILALLTDFGWQDPYVGIVKGVLLSINPNLSIIDLTHSIPPQDIQTAAFFLGEASLYYPCDTIFMAVVDPEVGSQRAALACRIGNHYFVGPDNGIFTLALQRARQENKAAICHQITEKGLCLAKISRTFHARDIFAPVAAHLSLGMPLEKVGPPKFDPVLLSWTSPRISGLTIEGEVQYIDGFGNLITNIHENHLSQLRIKPLYVTINERRIPILSAYSQAEVLQPLAILGGYDLLEISVRNGNAALLLGVQKGCKVTVTG